MIHPTIVRAMIAMAPPSSVVHKINAQARASLQADLDIMAGKKSGRFEARRDADALRLQIERQGQTGVIL